ncbi:hypothetical protein NDU88_002368 [Pleurodeles waltl]|uniref:Uncharacterized protein n=1 Tax=Pleurodeles waltl TaxID=8319 RepID=A0AAV7VAB7_PLEWA|nr:hypothetical protein NDU88_002368 [Pleurodeles waltl]
MRSLYYSHCSKPISLYRRSVDKVLRFIGAPRLSLHQSVFRPQLPCKNASGALFLAPCSQGRIEWAPHHSARLTATPKGLSPFDAASRSTLTERCGPLAHHTRIRIFIFYA